MTKKAKILKITRQPIGEVTFYDVDIGHYVKKDTIELIKTISPDKIKEAEFVVCMNCTDTIESFVITLIEIFGLQTIKRAQEEINKKNAEKNGS